MEKITHWHQLTITCKQEYSDELSAWLKLLEAQALTTTDDSPNSKLSALFPGNFSEKRMAQIKAFLIKNSATQLTFSQKIIQQDDWHTTQNQDLAPIEINQQLIIYPETYLSSVHSAQQANTNDINTQAIYIRAIDAFGTGNHPTTQQCLTWLSQQDLHDKIIIDYGSGSGILAIAAIKLGAKQVYAVDIDPDALNAVEYNAQLNQINPQQLIITNNLTEYIQHNKQNKTSKITADIILANIFVNTLCELKNTFDEYLSTHGCLLLAGLLTEQTETLQLNYQTHFSLKTISEQDGWPLVLGKKR